MRSTVMRASCTRCGFVDYIDMIEGKTQEQSAFMVGWELTRSADLCPSCLIERGKISDSYQIAIDAFHDNRGVDVHIKVGRSR